MDSSILTLICTDASLLDSNVQQCGAALQRILEHLSAQTNGWSFTVLMGGPDPLDPKGGNIITRSVSTWGPVELVTYQILT